MSAQKPVYSRPSDEEPTTAPKKRSRRKRKNATAKTNSITNRYPLHENDGVAEHHPTTTGAHHKRKNAALTAVNESFTPHEDDGVAFHDPITGTHHTRNQRTHRREKRRARELRAENERLHRRLAAIYDALTLD